MYPQQWTLGNKAAIIELRKYKKTGEQFTVLILDYDKKLSDFLVERIPTIQSPAKSEVGLQFFLFFARTVHPYQAARKVRGKGQRFFLFSARVGCNLNAGK